MTSTNFLPHMSTPDDPRAAAERWFARAQDAGFRPEEQRALDDWLAASPRHRSEFKALERLWQAAGMVDPARLRALAEPVSDSVPGIAAAGGHVRRRWRTAAAGAACAVAVGAGWLLWAGGSMPDARFAPTMAAAKGHYAASFATIAGERRILSLPDGSRVELNTRSRVSVQYSEGSRLVELLEGEAMFEVAPDAAWPFVVVAGAGRVTVTGTRFDVRRDAVGGAAVAVYVESGSVKVQGARVNASVPLTAGLGTTVTNDGAVAPAAPISLSSALAWREGKLVFQDAPLEEVAAEVSRYRREPVRVAGSATGRLRVSSVLRTDDTDALLSALPQFLPVGVRTLPDGSTVIFAQ
ncbi:FecR family protein [Cupriavidus sp. NPDC089707]|uniref:FecR family protein n=1 Tax=Cupriavidus sp. NPDC089707 TaxID=3363963 RepID=UPI0038308F69